VYGVVSYAMSNIEFAEQERLGSAHVRPLNELMAASVLAPVELFENVGSCVPAGIGSGSPNGHRAPGCVDVNARRVYG